MESLQDELTEHVADRGSPAPRAKFRSVKWRAAPTTPRSLLGLRRTSRASTYPTGWRFKHIRAGLYRLCAGDVACPVARLAFAVWIRPSVAHNPASKLGSPFSASSYRTRRGASAKEPRLPAAGPRLSSASTDVLSLRREQTAGAWRLQKSALGANALPSSICYDPLPTRSFGVGKCSPSESISDLRRDVLRKLARQPIPASKPFWPKWLRNGKGCLRRRRVEAGNATFEVPRKTLAIRA